MIATDAFCPTIGRSPFAALADAPPWEILAALPALLARALESLGDGWRVEGGIAVHRSATVEPGAVVKPPAMIGPGSLVAATAYLRGGVFLAEDCAVGPGAELKTAILLAGAKLAHLNFVGDSILGEAVNCEAGAIVANHRNERPDKRIRILFGGAVIDTGVDRFGALLGDGARLGANSVVAPGAILRPGAVLARLALLDQSPP